MRERMELVEEDESIQAIAKVCRLVEGCRRPHFALHDRLVGDRNMFLNES